ncbi:MAG: ferredoxin [Selenomonadaceae bacterium]|nr:ferredoxin [Selenomonadaceae bacterium]
MKRLSVTDECIACGQCFGDWLVESSDGKSMAAGIGILTDAEAKDVEDAVEGCPVQAIELTDWLVGSGDESERLAAIKNALNELEGYQVHHPTTDEMICDRSPLKIALPTGGLRSGYSYRNDSQAEREGLKAFGQIAHSRRRELAQSVLVQYKKIYLDQYNHFEANDSCYYYREGRKVEQWLKAYAAALSEATGGKLVVPNELTQFQLEPDNLKTFAIAVNEFEDTYAVQRALENVEGLGWYDSWIDSPEKDLATRSVYAYDISGAVRELGNHITSGCMTAIREVGVKMTNDIVKWYQGVVTKDLQTKVRGFRLAIDEYEKN